MVIFRKLSSVFLIVMMVRLAGRILVTDSPHSITIILAGFLRFSSRSSAMRPGF